MLLTSLSCNAIAVPQVVDFTVDNGQVQLSIGEAEVNSVNLQFIDPKTGGVKEQGATKPEVITRYLTIAPGKVYSLRQAKQDIDSIYSTGLFEDVNIIPKEADDSTEQNPRVGGSACCGRQPQLGCSCLRMCLA